MRSKAAAAAALCASMRRLTTTVRSCPPLAMSAAEEEGAAPALPAVPGRDRSCSSNSTQAVSQSTHSIVTEDDEETMALPLTLMMQRQEPAQVEQPVTDAERNCWD